MKIPLSHVYDPPHVARALQPDAVARLAGSMRIIGLRHPITVRRASRIVGGRPIEAWEIVAGRHRVEAARQLGWTEIEAETEMADDPTLWTISENLHRADLTVLERSEHLDQWRKLRGEKANTQDGHSHTGGRPDRGHSAIARELGISRQAVERAERIASVSPEVKHAIRDAGLDDNQGAQLRIAKEPTAELQLAAVRAEAARCRQSPAALSPERISKLRDTAALVGIHPGLAAVGAAIVAFGTEEEIRAVESGIATLSKVIAGWEAQA